MIIIGQSETTSIQSGQGGKPPRHAKTLIAIPATQYMPTRFVRCLENLRRLPETYTSIIEGSVIHDSRNEFASIAIQNGFDRVLCIDSDMTFTPDLLTRLSAHLDSGKRMVCGLYFKRVLPTEPVIYRQETATDPNHGEYIKSTPLLTYPRNTLFQIDACGFGAVMMDVSLLREVWDRYGPPFTPYLNLGEDLTFCWRVRQLGVPIWCDSTIRVGHLGQVVFSEETYLDQCSMTGYVAHNQKETAVQSENEGPGHGDHNRNQSKQHTLANNQPDHK